MVDQELTREARSYLQVTAGFIQGLIRIWSAEAASSRLMCALTTFHASGRPGLDGPSTSVLQHLDRIPYESYDALSYVTDVSHLVYATTLLDTFLNDTTMFLFLLFPGSMGKNQQVPLRTLIDSTSRNEALTRAAASRARELGYLSFSDRLSFLRESFGLSIDLDKDTADALLHYSSVRNAAVHDQGIFDLALDESGLVQARQKACVRHPTQLRAGDVQSAIRAYERVARTVAKSVFRQALKQTEHPAIQGFLREPIAAKSDDA